MGKMLSGSDSIEAIRAMKEFQRAYGRQSHRRIEVERAGANILSLPSVEVFVGEDAFSNPTINPGWEDVIGEDYKAHGLFGYYSSAYCKCKYEDGTLTIMSDRGVILKIMDN